MRWQQLIKKGDFIVYCGWYIYMWVVHSSTHHHKVIANRTICTYQIPDNTRARREMENFIRFKKKKKKKRNPFFKYTTYTQNPKIVEKYYYYDYDIWLGRVRGQYRMLDHNILWRVMHFFSFSFFSLRGLWHYNVFKSIYEEKEVNSFFFVRKIIVDIIATLYVSIHVFVTEYKNWGQSNKKQN